MLIFRFTFRESLDSETITDTIKAHDYEQAQERLCDAWEIPPHKIISAHYRKANKPLQKWKPCF